MLIWGPGGAPPWRTPPTFQPKSVPRPECEPDPATITLSPTLALSAVSSPFLSPVSLFSPGCPAAVAASSLPRFLSSCGHNSERKTEETSNTHRGNAAKGRDRKAVAPSRRPAAGGRSARTHRANAEPALQFPAPTHPTHPTHSRFTTPTHTPPHTPTHPHTHTPLNSLDSDAALNAAWARRAGMVSHLPRSARVVCRGGPVTERQRRNRPRRRPGVALQEAQPRFSDSLNARGQ